MTDPLSLRFAAPEDFDALESIETAADRLLVERFQATDWPETTPARERAGYAGFTILAEHPGACGFSPSIPVTAFQRRLVEVEARLDLERWGPRIQMTAALDDRSG